MITPQIFTNVINSYLPEPHASLLNGIIFGVNLKTGKEFYSQLKMVGLIHLVVLSGMNITLLANFITLSTISLGRKISTVITILSVIIFVVFVGPQAPIIRAAIMGILTFVAVLYGKKSTALYSLFLSGLIIGIIKPDWLRTISFQLSYAATFGLIIFTPKKLKESKYKLVNYLKDEFATSMSAQIFTVPLIFIYFKQISLISPFSNILVAWLIAPLMIFGFLTAILGKIFYPLGIIPSYICYGILEYMVWVVRILSKIPYGFINIKQTWINLL